MPVMPLALFAFFGFGLLLVLPGALQPALARALALDLAQSGGIASALLGGVGAGVLGSGPLIDRLPRRPLFVAAALACAGALALAAVARSYGVLLAALALLGAAGGGYETLLNAAIPESRPERAAPRLAVAHAAATLGAALGAPAIASAASALGASRVLGVLAALLAGLGLAGACTRFPSPPSARRGAPPASPLPIAALAPLAVASAAYVGVETAFSVMLPALASARGLAPLRGALGMSAFWAGLFVTRLAFARLGLPARSRELVWGSGLAALALAGYSVVGATGFEIWSAAVGLALGAVFPVLVVLAGDLAPARRATGLALVVAAGSLGGGALPWLAGEAGARWATFVIAAGCVAIGLSARLARRA